MYELGAACWDNCQTTPLSSLSNPLQVLSTLFAKPFSHYYLFASDCCVVHLRSECFNKPAAFDLEPCICCPFAPCWLIIIAHVVVEAAAVTRVWASQTTQCYTDHTMHNVTQCGQRASAAERTGSVHLRALLHLFPVLASDFHHSHLSLSFCPCVSQWFDNY